MLTPINEGNSYAGQSERERKDRLIQQIAGLMKELSPNDDALVELMNQNSTNLTERRRYESRKISNMVSELETRETTMDDNRRQRALDQMRGVPTFTGTGYQNWAALMEMILQNNGLWNVVTIPASDISDPIWIKDNAAARTGIFLSINSEQQDLVFDLKHSAYGMWNKLQSIHATRTTLSKAYLYKEVSSFTMAPGQTVREYVQTFKSLMTLLQEQEVRVEEEQLAATFVNGLSPAYEFDKDTLLNEPVLSLDRAITRMLSKHMAKEAFEERQKLRMDQQREAMAMMTISGGIAPEISPNDSNSAALLTTPTRERRLPRKCYYCNKLGHVKQNCPVRAANMKLGKFCFVCGLSDHLAPTCPNRKLEATKKD